MAYIYSIRIEFSKSGVAGKFFIYFLPVFCIYVKRLLFTAYINSIRIGFSKNGVAGKNIYFFARAKRSSQPYILFGVCIGRDGSIDRAARILRDGSVSRIGGVARFGSSGDYVVNRYVRAADYDRDAML